MTRRGKSATVDSPEWLLAARAIAMVIDRFRRYVHMKRARSTYRAKRRMRRYR